MSKGLKALDALRFDVSMSQDINYKEANKECDIIEKELNALEMLKNKMTIETDYYDSDLGCEEFEYIAYNGEPLNIENQELFDLLKGVIQK